MVKVNPKTKKATFQITLPEAHSVAVVGDFNNWSDAANPMNKGKNGVWKTEVKLDEGDHQFRYLVNRHEWMNDPELRTVPNQFGSENSVVNVKYPAEKKAAVKKPAAKKTATKQKSK